MLNPGSQGQAVGPKGSLNERNCHETTQGSQGNLWTNIYSFLSFVSIVSSRIFCFRRFIIIVYDLIKLTEFTNSCSCSCWNFLKKHHRQTPSPSSQALQGSDESDITIEASAKFSSSVTDWAGDTALGTALSPSPLFGFDAQKKPAAEE